MQRCNHRPPATLSELAPAARSLVTWRDSEVGYHRWWRPGPAPIEAVGRRALAPVLKPKERSAWSCVSACAGHSGIKHDRQRRARPRDAPTRPRWRTAAALPAGPSANFHWPTFTGQFSQGILCLSKIKSEHIRGASRPGLGGKEYACLSKIKCGYIGGAAR